MPMKEQAKQEPEVWPLVLHFNNNDLGFRTEVVNALKPVRSVTKFLSLQNFRIGAVSPKFTSTINVISVAQIPARSTGSKCALIDSISSRLSMLLCTE